jgi:DNA-binding response OmpR family regulator
MSNVLIIEGETTQRTAVEAVVKGWGHRCRTVADAAAARTRLEEAEVAFEVVLLDWGLPNGECRQLLEWIEQEREGADLEVIVQSRGEVPADIRDGINRGAYFYLTKPYEWPQLRALIQAAESSLALKRSLNRRVSEIQDIVSLLDNATLALRELEEAEIVAAHLGAAAGDPQLGVGILELLLNGIEHGNLGITYEEKTRLRESGEYEVEIARRLGAPEHRDKLVTVEIKRVGDHLDILISDCGPGFDYRSYLTFDRQRVLHSHGRGVLLASGLLTTNYLDPGNRVQVELPLATREA